MFRVAGIKPKARLDEENHRYIIEPLEANGGMRVGTALQAIKETKVTWRQIADFFGLSDSSEAFRLAVVQKPLDQRRKVIKEYLTIENGTAYFYDKDHKPANASEPHIPVTVVNKSVALTVNTNKPTKVTTRITLKDPVSRTLTMSIIPTNGYILGLGDLNICNPGATYVTKGNAKTLNNVLRTIYFVGCNYGDANVRIVINDGGGKANSITSAEVDLTVVASPEPSIPTLELPESVNIVLGADSAISGVEVADEDNKLLELRVSPFGCEVFGFKSLLGTISQGEVRSVVGRAATINSEIAGLTVRTDREDAQVGFELICGKFIVRKYLKFSVGGEVVVDPTDNQPIVDNATVDETVLEE